MVVAGGDAPALFHELLSRCLAIDPASRFADWTEVETGLAVAHCTATGRPAPDLEGAAPLSRAEQVTIGWSYCALGV